LIGKKIKSSSTASVALGQILAARNFVNGSGEQPGCYTSFVMPRPSMKD